MTWKLASLLALLFFALLVLGSNVASAQSPDGASHERVQQQRAPAACPPDIQWGCVLSGSLSPGLTLNSTSTANNATSLYATLSSPGSGSAAVWGRVLGASTTRGYGVYGSHQGSGFGVYGNSNTGTGFRGFSNTGTGMHGSTNGTGTQAGVLGEHTATGGEGAGVEGRTNSTSERAVGVRGVVLATDAEFGSAGVRGINNGTGAYRIGVRGEAAGAGVGVHGWSPNGKGVEGYSPGGWGVFGHSADAWGVYGWSINDYGIYGESDNSAGVVGRGNPAVRGEGHTGGYGVVGEANGSNGYGVFGDTDDGKAVYGTASGTGDGIRGFSRNGYAGNFLGDVRVTGELIVGPAAMTSRQDHPLDPENQYLQHAAIESSERLNLYTGNVVLDEQGRATVELPAWFTAVNHDFRYQLTSIGGFAPLYIAQKVENNRFVIAGGTPGMEVSWEVTAVRGDPYARGQAFQAEVPKPEDERGTYLYPEGYGQPESRGVNYEERQRLREMQDTAPAPVEAPGR